MKDLREAEYVEGGFENLYFKIREKENRIYTDSELEELPNISSSNPYYREWEIRKKTCNRLIQYLKEKNKPLKILEVGCGNGWLSHQLSKIYGVQVWGLDPHGKEIEQAQRVFKEENLEFIYGKLDQERLKNQSFDLIIFAASIQYFPSLKEVLSDTEKALSPRGELIIQDSPFYSPEKLEEARQRSLDYYTLLQCPEMAPYYFHHTLKELEGFMFTILFDPNSLLNKLIIKDPFYWISITKTG